MNKPFSQACENNKDPILEKIIHIFQPGDTVLEIGSGTGQHVLYFTTQLPEVTWLPAELNENMHTLLAGLEGEERSNLQLPPLTLDTSEEWPDIEVDGIFAANCLHIMSQNSVTCFFEGVGRLLRPGGNLCVYGPFKYQDQFTTESNAEFDQWLKARNPVSGIRDFEMVDELAAKEGLTLMADYSLPANNQLIHWQRALPEDKAA